MHKIYKLRSNSHLVSFLEYLMCHQPKARVFYVHFVLYLSGNDFLCFHVITFPNCSHIRYFLTIPFMSHLLSYATVKIYVHKFEINKNIFYLILLHLLSFTM